MRVLLLSNTTLSLSPLPLSETLKSPIRSNFKRNSINWAEKALVGALGGALSLCLLVSSPSLSIAIEPSPSSSPPSTEYCHEEGGGEAAELLVPEAAMAVTNEGIVEEAWEIVNDSFINTGRLSSFPETWQVHTCAFVELRF